MTLNDIRRTIDEAKDAAPPGARVAFLVHPDDWEAVRAEVEFYLATCDREAYREATSEMRLFGVRIAVSAFAPRGNLSPVPAEVLEPFQPGPLRVR